MNISRAVPSFVLPDLSCFIRPLLVLGSMGRKSLNQVISGSGLPLAAQSMVAVRVRSTTFSCGPMSMLGNPAGRRSSVGENMEKLDVSYQLKVSGRINSTWNEVCRVKHRDVNNLLGRPNLACKRRVTKSGLARTCSSTAGVSNPATRGPLSCRV